MEAIELVAAEFEAGVLKLRVLEEERDHLHGLEIHSSGCRINKSRSISRSPKKDMILKY